MANQGPPPGAIMECLWDKDGKFAIKEDDWECSGCSSYNDNKEEVNGKLEQLYKCATCDQTRPGFANIRKKKEAEARKANPEDGLTGFQISFGGDTAVAGSSPAIDIFGGGSVGKSKKSSPAAAGSAPALDLFGNGGAAKAEAPALNLFGSPAPATGPAVVVSFGATDPAAPAPAAGLDLFGAGSSASAPSSDAKAGGASLNVGELLAFAGSSPSKTSPAKPRKRKAEGGGAAKKTRRSEPAAEDAGAAPANVEFVRPADRNASAAAGHLFSWGSGECDQLGHGKVLEDDEGLMDLEVHRPRQISDVKDHDFVFICCGGLHTAALERSGVVFTWGCNDDKALGRVVDQKQALLDFYAKADPKKEEAAISKIFDKYHAAGRVDDLFAKLGKKYGFFPVDESVPGPVTTISEPVVQVECGNSHTVALTESGRVILWGCYKDASGQLGFDSEGTDTQVLPREVPGLFKAYGKVVQVASGGDHTLALTEKGVVIAWGDAEQGQVARKVPSRHKQQGLRLHPVSFPKGVKVKSIFAGGFCSFAVTESGEAFSWGLNNYGQLGCGDHESRFAVTPLSIPGEEIVQVASGIHHTLILTRAGRVFGAGKCQSGQLGGPKAQFVKSGFVEPEMVTALLEHVVVEVACGSNFNVCRTKKGKVFVFGSNQMSQLGLGGDEDEVYLPRELALTRFDDSGKVQVLQIDAGAQHSVAIVKVAK